MKHCTPKFWDILLFFSVDWVPISPMAILGIVLVLESKHSASSEDPVCPGWSFYFAPFHLKTDFLLFHCISIILLSPFAIKQTCDHLELPSICTQHLWSSARVTTWFLFTSLTKTFSSSSAQFRWTVSSDLFHFIMMEATVLCINLIWWKDIGLHFVCLFTSKLGTFEMV